ncbi:MAG: Xaa-Pro peptidase family protein [Planctomycetota bacterium]
MKLKPLFAAALPLLSSCIFVWEKDLVASAPFQEPKPAETEPVALARVGDGKPVCGLGKAFHIGRRAELMKRIGPELLVFRGQAGPRENLAFRQDKNFWYLTGIESPNVALVLDGKTEQAILFLPEQNLAAESWEGELWDAGDAWVADLTGFTDVRTNDQLVPTLEKLLDGRKKLGTNLCPSILLAGSYDAAIPFEKAQESDPLDGRVSREKALAAKLGEKLGVEVFDVYPTLVEMRMVKTSEEVAAMKRAARSGALAHVEAMRSTRAGLGEWELDALMTFVQNREGAFGKAYEAIVGSARNSCVLHYVANDKQMSAGEVLLIDYGPEVDHYVTDITRSWPVDGTFTPRQAELYDAVLAAQKAGIAAAKPGATIQDVSKAVDEVYKQRGLFALKRHGPCHWIGMEVHDPGDIKVKLEPGMAFTIEPGLYETATGIGIRIEDVVVITPTGCEVISDLAPKERAEVERTVREVGLLDLRQDDKP